MFVLKIATATTTFSILFCFAQTTPNPDRGASLVIGTTELRLGMPQADVLSKLGNEFEATKIKGADTWMIYQGNRDSTGVGSVSFTDGKVSSADKNLTVIESRDAARALGSFYLALRDYGSLKGRNFRPVWVTTEEGILPPDPDGSEIRVRYIEIAVGGNKNVSISIAEKIGSNAPPRVTVHEGLTRAQPESGGRKTTPNKKK